MCDRYRSCLCNDRENADDMKEKDEPIDRYIDHRDDRSFADVKEDQDSRYACSHWDIITCLSDTFHPTHEARHANSGEVGERKACYNDAYHDVQVYQNWRRARSHHEKEFNERDPDHRVQSHPELHTITPRQRGTRPQNLSDAIFPLITSQVILTFLILNYCTSPIIE